MSEIFNSRHFASKCHIRHIRHIAQASQWQPIVLISPFSSKCHALVISRDQQAKIADT